MARYRIVKDAYNGFEVQSWRWWFPFWVQPTVNTHSSAAAAREFARKKLLGIGRVVEYIDTNKED